MLVETVSLDGCVFSTPHVVQIIQMQRPAYIASCRLCNIKQYAWGGRNKGCASASRWQCRLQHGYLHRALSVWVRDNIDMLLNTSGQQQSGTSVIWLRACRVSVKLKLSPQLSPFTQWSYGANYAPYVKGRQGGRKSVRGAHRRKNKSRNISWCWWGVTGVKCIITRRMSVVNLSSSTAAEDIIVVSLPESLLSWKSTPFSPSTLKSAAAVDRQDTPSYQDMFCTLKCNRVMILTFTVLITNFIALRQMFILWKSLNTHNNYDNHDNEKGDIVIVFVTRMIMSLE